MSEANRYRKVQPRMWADEKIRRLTWPPPCGLSLFQYLMTGRETVALPGALDTTESGLAERLRWDVEGLRRAFAEVSREGLAKADWTAGLVWLPGGPRNNPPESPNVVRAWAKAFVELPECSLKAQVYWDVRDYVETLGEGFNRAFAQSWRHPSPNQEQKQKQEQEQEIRRSRTSRESFERAPLAEPDERDEQPPAPDPAALLAALFAERTKRLIASSEDMQAARSIVAQVGERWREVFEHWWADAFVQQHKLPLSNLAKYTHKHTGPAPIDPEEQRELLRRARVAASEALMRARLEPDDQQLADSAAEARAVLDQLRASKRGAV